MVITDRIDDYCFPIDATFDVDKLKESINILFDRLNISEDIFHDELKTKSAISFNLTHLPNLQGIARWKKYRGDHDDIKKAGVKEEDFSEFLSELDGLYLKEIIDNILAIHNSKFTNKFQGRCQLIWLRPTHSYKLHRDMHTAHRYHLPITTDGNCLWIFETAPRDMSLCHMPADGRIWYLNPKDIKHSVAHLGTQCRLHLLLTTNN
jgi:hypothetical protein